MKLSGLSASLLVIGLIIGFAGGLAYGHSRKPVWIGGAAEAYLVPAMWRLNTRTGEGQLCRSINEVLHCTPIIEPPSSSTQTCTRRRLITGVWVPPDPGCPPEAE